MACQRILPLSAEAITDVTVETISIGVIAGVTGQAAFDWTAGRRIVMRRKDTVRSGAGPGAVPCVTVSLRRVGWRLGAAGGSSAQISR